MKKIILLSFGILALTVGCKTKTENKPNELKIALEPKSGTATSGTVVFSEKSWKSYVYGEHFRFNAGSSRHSHS